MYGFAFATTISEAYSYLPFALGAHFGASTLYFSSLVSLVLVILAIITGFVRIMNLPVLALAAGTTAVFLWPFTFEIVFFPSLHEKGVLLLAALLLWWTHWATQVKSNAMFLVVTVILITLSTMTKTNMLVFYPGLTLAALFLNLGYSKVFRRFILIGAYFLASAFLVGIGLFGDEYGASQRSGTLAGNLSAPYAMLILGVVVAYGVYVGVRFLRGSRSYLELVPLVMMATFWASIVYFGYRNYFLSIFGVMFGSAVAVVVGNLKSVRLQQLATVGLIVVTVGWTLYRIPQVFEPLRGIGAFTQGQIAKDLADEGAVIYTSCVEGSGHFNYYTERKWGVTPEFKPLEGDAAGYRFGIPDDGQYVFGDRRLCAAPGEMAEWDVIWASPGDDGFRLYKRPA
jgi:hypothetical protein